MTTRLRAAFSVMIMSGTRLRGNVRMECGASKRPNLKCLNTIATPKSTCTCVRVPSFLPSVFLFSVRRCAGLVGCGDCSSQSPALPRSFSSVVTGAKSCLRTFSRARTKPSAAHMIARLQTLSSDRVICVTAFLVCSNVTLSCERYHHLISFSRTYPVGYNGGPPIIDSNSFDEPEVKTFACLVSNIYVDSTSGPVAKLRESDSTFFSSAPTDTRCRHWFAERLPAMARR